ncbi:MAG TPA: alpha/beta fold hydrolase [bacterium]|nr:alpha/beta fold hydrolase [bacterium]
MVTGVHPGERLLFPSAGRDLIAYRYVPAPGVGGGDRGGPVPAVVLNHGSGLEQDSKPGVARVLTDAGYVVFVPFRRGYAGSPGPSRLEEVPAPAGAPGHDEQVCARLLAESDDVLAALRFVRAMPGVDPARVGVMGSSYGGINSLLAAARDGRLRACVSFAAAAMSWGPVPGLRPFLLRHVDTIRCPLLLLQAENDFDTSPSEALAARRRAADGVCERHLFPPFGASPIEAHQIWVHAPNLWAPVVLPFLARYVQGRA